MGRKKRRKEKSLEHRVAEGAHQGAHIAHVLHDLTGTPPANTQGALAHAASTAAVMTAGAAVGAGTVLIADDATRRAAAKTMVKAKKRAEAAADAAMDWVKGLW